MKKAGLIKNITLAALVGLFSREVAASDKFSIYGGFGGYIPSNQENTLGGIPYGFGGGVDVGTKYAGFRAGVDYYTKFGNVSGEIDYSGRVREGQGESVILIRGSGGLRFGTPVLHIGVGGFAMEAQNIFDRSDRKFLSQTVEQFIDSKVYYGPYGEVVVGGQFKGRCGFFVNAGIDYFAGLKERRYGVRMKAGVNFSP